MQDDDRTLFGLQTFERPLERVAVGDGVGMVADARVMDLGERDLDRPRP